MVGTIKFLSGKRMAKLLERLTGESLQKAKAMNIEKSYDTGPIPFSLRPGIQ
jgi:hypothetical protein